MQQRDAASALPASVFVRRLAVVVGLVTAVAIGGTIGVVLSKPGTTPATDTRRDARPFEIGYAQWELDRYVTEAFPQWTAAAPGRACPRDILELNAHRPFLHAIDPWGAVYQLACANGGIAMRSAGPDGVHDTADDLVSTP